MNSLKLVLILLLACLHGLIQAQQNFQPAIIFSKTGDTIPGYIDYRQWDKSPETIHFRQNEESPTINMNPLTIAGFSVSGECYISSVIGLDGTPYTYRELPRTITQKIIIDTVFLKTLVLSDGGMDLYSLKDSRGKQHYFIHDSGSMTELIDIKYYSESEQSGIVMHVYKDQLYEWMEECPPAAKASLDADLKTDDLIEAITNFDSCLAVPIDYISPILPLKKVFGLAIGYGINRVTYPISMVSTGYGTADFNWGPTYYGALFYDIDMASNRESFWLCFDGGIAQNKSSGTYFGEIGNSHESGSFTFSALETLVSTQFKWQSNAPHFKPYLKAGYLATFEIQQSNSMHTEKYNIYVPDVVTVTDEENSINYRKFANHIVGQTGLSINNKYFIELTYSTGLTKGADDFVSTNRDRLTLGLKYGI